MKTKLRRVTVLSNNSREKSIRCPNTDCLGRSVYCEEVGVFLCEDCNLATILYREGEKYGV